jgi:hypothetical protein
MTTTTTTARPAHIPGIDLWNCPCRECTKLDWQATDQDVSLAAFRREGFPEHYGAPTPSDFREQDGPSAAENAGNYGINGRDRNVR